jgi:short-subunit dehydrogenase
VVNGITVLLPRMRAHGEGAHVLATCSSSGLVAGGGIGVYITSKFAVMGLMESLRDELAGTNVGVSVFCPGFVKSNLVESEKMRPPQLRNEIEKPSTIAPTAEAEAMMRKFMAVAMDPLEAGVHALEGIRRNDLYIFTHQEFEQATRERMEALLAAFPTSKAPAARAMTARRFMTAIYHDDRERLFPRRKTRFMGSRAAGHSWRSDFPDSRETVGIPSRPLGSRGRMIRTQ